MKLATLGLATALAFTRQFRARAVRRRLDRRKLGHGRRGNERHDDRIFRHRNDNRQFDGCTEHRHVKRRRQRRGRSEQRTEPVGQARYQSLAQRLDPDAGACRPIIASR